MSAGNVAKKETREPAFTFLTNHSHVLVCIAEDANSTIRQIAAQVGITERAVAGILADLVRVGVIVANREGRRNHYSIIKTMHLRHPLEEHKTVGDLLKAVL